MKRFATLLCVVSLWFVNATANAGMILFIAPEDLQFSGPGAHQVDVRVQHDGTGASTLSGYTIRFGTAANASLGVLPAGVTAISATESLPVSSNGLFSLNASTTTVAASSLIGDQNIGVGGIATLFTLNLNLGAGPTYTIGVDFQNAQRGGLFATQIGSEFFPTNSPTTDFSFTLTAVPEPSTCVMLIGTAGVVGFIRRRRKRQV
jgi:hypothetical protein